MKKLSFFIRYPTANVSQENTIRWNEPTSITSKEVIGHRVYYKEYGIEGILGHEDVPMGRDYVVITGKEFKWDCFAAL